MKFERLTPRSVLTVGGMLGGFALAIMSLMLAAYLRSGNDLALLVAAGGSSIAVPISGLLVLLAASWQRAESEQMGLKKGEDDGSAPCGRVPVIDRSIVLVGNGHEQLSLEASAGTLRIAIGTAIHSHRPPTGPSPIVHEEGDDLAAE